MRLRLAAWMCVGLVFLASSRQAAACGGWQLRDHERQQTVEFLIHSVNLWVPGKEHRLIFRVEGERPREQFADEQHARIDLSHGRLTRQGKKIGFVQGSGVIIRGRAYEILVTRREPVDWLDEINGPFWHVDVCSAGTLIASGDAMAFVSTCGGGAGEATEEIVRRVIFYLAWRDSEQPAPDRP